MKSTSLPTIEEAKESWRPRSLAQKIGELQNVKEMIEFRIQLQKKLINKIEVGKFKSRRVAKPVIYTLAKHDLKLLLDTKKEVESRLPKLKKELNNDDPLKTQNN